MAAAPFNDEGMAAVGKFDVQLENFRTCTPTRPKRERASQVAREPEEPAPRPTTAALRRHVERPHLSDATLRHTCGDEVASKGLILDEARLSEKALEQLSALPNLKTLEIKRVERSRRRRLRAEESNAASEERMARADAEEKTALERFLKP